MNQTTRSSFTGIVDAFKNAPAPLFGDRQVHLHLGAHKTATTFLQGSLRKNRSILFENGVFYIPLHEMRAKKAENKKSLTNLIVSLSQHKRPSRKLPDLRKKALAYFDPEQLRKCHTILISDENLSLQLPSFINGEGYPAMNQRLMHLKNELGPKLKVFFSIRDYPDFLSSIYVEILRYFPYVPFGDFLTGLYEDMPHLWSDAYHNLVQLFGEENVVIWDFKDTVKHPGEVLSMLTGNVQGLEIQDKPSRQSLSQKAVDFIRDFSMLPGEPIAAPILAKVAGRLHPLSKMNSKFDPWTPREKKVLRQHFMEERKSIPLWSPTS